MPFARIIIAIAGTVALSILPNAAFALPSTAKGQISVAQVMEMMAKADSSTVAKQVLVAYVAGVGESAGVVLDTMGNNAPVSCRQAFSLDTASVRTALENGAPKQQSWAQTPATPLIVADMIKRAGCRIKE